MFAVGLGFLLGICLVGALAMVSVFSLPLLVHGIFVLAAMPLMWAALLHFVPVLTRSAGASRLMSALPAMAAILATFLLSAFAFEWPRYWLALFAGLLLGALLVLFRWAGLRSRRALGAPHPGVKWYLLAMGFLALGLMTVAGMIFDPSQFAKWWRLHFHLNLFGWVGVMVLGTMPVLLPTCLQKFDGNAAFRLRRSFPWTALGVLLLAFGAAGSLPLSAALGAMLLGSVVFIHGFAWLSLYGRPWRWPGPAVSLGLGALALLILLMLGVAHGFGWIAGMRLLPVFIAAFLLPTVLGALSQLLPVWRYSGLETPARVKLHQSLSAGAGVRGGLCFLAGFGTLSETMWSLILVAPAVMWLLYLVLADFLKQAHQPKTVL